MVDYRQFHTYVENTKVTKYYDHIVLPDGRVVQTTKYVKVYSESPMHIGFEDGTSEIGESPDFDYNEPELTEVSDTGFIFRTAKIDYYYSGAYTNDLYYDDTLLMTFHPGDYRGEIDVNYINWFELLLTALGVAAVGLGIYVASRK